MRRQPWLSVARNQPFPCAVRWAAQQANRGKTGMQTDRGCLVNDRKYLPFAKARHLLAIRIMARAERVGVDPLEQRNVHIRI